MGPVAARSSGAGAARQYGQKGTGLAPRHRRWLVRADEEDAGAPSLPRPAASGSIPAATSAAEQTERTAAQRDLLSKFRTVVACHRPPREVRIPRLLSASAIALQLEMLDARMLSMIGRRHRPTAPASPRQAAGSQLRLRMSRPRLADSPGSG